MHAKKPKASKVACETEQLTSSHHILRPSRYQGPLTKRPFAFEIITNGQELPERSEIHLNRRTSEQKNATSKAQNDQAGLNTRRVQQKYPVISRSDQQTGQTS
jgi:hypothetical protein